MRGPFLVVRNSDRYCQHIAKALSEHVNEWRLAEPKARLSQDCLVEAVSGNQQGNNGHFRCQTGCHFAFPLSLIPGAGLCLLRCVGIVSNRAYQVLKFFGRLVSMSRYLVGPLRLLTNKYRSLQMAAAL